MSLNMTIIIPAKLLVLRALELCSFVSLTKWAVYSEGRNSVLLTALSSSSVLSPQQVLNKH